MIEEDEPQPPGMDEYLFKMLDMVKAHGVAIQYVMGGAPFGYTVGLTIYKRHPEIITFGMDPPNTTGILNALARRVIKDKEVLAHGQVFDDLAEGYSGMLIAVADEEVDEYLGIAKRLYDVGPRRVTSLQLVFQGPDLLWPWEKGSVYTDTGYPLLGFPPDTES